MKKLLIIAMALSLASCTKTIDKKVVGTNYQADIEEIKANNSDYTDADYKVAAQELDKYSMKLMSNPDAELDVTYRELLDKAKEMNVKAAQEREAYNASLDKLRAAFDIKTTAGKYVDISELYPTYSHGYIIEITSENKTDKEITAVKGKIVLTNDKGERLMHIGIDEAVVFAPHEKTDGNFSSIIFEDDNYVELKSLPFSAITQEWQPKRIIFKDGTTLEALPEPIY